MDVRSPAFGHAEAGADLDALLGLNAHHRARDPGVQLAIPVDVTAQAGRHAERDDLENPADGVALFLSLVDASDHRRLRGLVERADG